MGATVVVVEDNEENRRLTTFLLHAFGHRPIGARSGAAGIEVALRERPDLILMDIQMPEMDGYEALRRIRAEPALAKTPVVAITALAMVGDRETGIEAGFDGYITKPITPQRFSGQIDAFLPSHLRSTVPRKEPAA